MESPTASVLLAAPADEVFDDLSRTRTAPEWATQFVRSFEVVSPDEARPCNTMEEVLLRMSSDRDTEVIVRFSSGGEAAAA